MGFLGAGSDLSSQYGFNSGMSIEEEQALLKMLLENEQEMVPFSEANISGGVAVGPLQMLLQLGRYSPDILRSIGLLGTGQGGLMSGRYADDSVVDKGFTAKGPTSEWPDVYGEDDVPRHVKPEPHFPKGKPVAPEYEIKRALDEVDPKLIEMFGEGGTGRDPDDDDDDLVDYMWKQYHKGMKKLESGKKYAGKVLNKKQFKKFIKKAYQYPAKHPFKTITSPLKLASQPFQYAPKLSTIGGLGGAAALGATRDWSDWETPPTREDSMSNILRGIEYGDIERFLQTKQLFGEDKYEDFQIEDLLNYYGKVSQKKKHGGKVRNYQEGGFVMPWDLDMNPDIGMNYDWGMNTPGYGGGMETQPGGYGDYPGSSPSYTHPQIGRKPTDVSFANQGPGTWDYNGDGIIDNLDLYEANQQGVDPSIIENMMGYIIGGATGGQLPPPQAGIGSGNLTGYNPGRPPAGVGSVAASGTGLETQPGGYGDFPVGQEYLSPPGGRKPVGMSFANQGPGTWDYNGDGIIDTLDWTLAQGQGVGQDILTNMMNYITGGQGAGPGWTGQVPGLSAPISQGVGGQGLYPNPPSTPVDYTMGEGPTGQTQVDPYGPGGGGVVPPGGGMETQPGGFYTPGQGGSNFLQPPSPTPVQGIKSLKPGGGMGGPGWWPDPPMPAPGTGETQPGGFYDPNAGGDFPVTDPVYTPPNRDDLSTQAIGMAEGGYVPMSGLLEIGSYSPENSLQSEIVHIDNESLEEALPDDILAMLMTLLMSGRLG